MATINLNLLPDLEVHEAVD
jgi:hypothetical protein